MTGTKRRTRGTGQVVQSGRIWKIRYTGPDGQRVQESTRSTRKKDAVRLLNQRLGEITEGRWMGPNADNLTFGDLKQMLTDHYHNMRSRERAERALHHLKRHFGLYKAVKITADVLTRYVRKRREEGAFDASIKYELATLKKGFNLAIRAEKLSKKPAFPTLKIENTRTGFFERDELDSLLEHLPEELHGVVEFMYHTGWRKNEVLTRQWQHVDFDVGMIRLEPGETKNGKGRTFPFSSLPELAAVLERQHEYTKAAQRRLGSVVPWIFHREGRRVRYFSAAWQTACIKAGFAVPKTDENGNVVKDKKGKPVMVATRIPHDFRRSAVRNLERAGVPRSAAMELVGHQTESIYRRYAITNEQDLKDGVEKLAALSRTTKESRRRRAIAGTIRHT